MELWSNSAAVRQFSAFAQAKNIQLDAVLDSDLLDVVHSVERSEFVPANTIVDILQACGTRCHAPGIGAEAASWVNVRGGYGPLSSLWEYAPSFAALMRVTRDYMHLENGALGVVLERDGDEVAINHMLMIDTRYGGTEFMEAQLTLTLRLARTVLGEAWSPLRVEFAHSAPEDPSRLRRLFRCPVDFDAERNAMVLLDEDFQRDAPGRNTHMFAFLEEHLLRDPANPQRDFVDRVEWLIAAELKDGGMTIDRVAAKMTMSVRTLQRRLMDKGWVFADLVQHARVRIATDYFRTARTATLTQLAFRLGYSDATGASRFLRRHFGKGVRALSDAAEAARAS